MQTIILLLMVRLNKLFGDILLSAIENKLQFNNYNIHDENNTSCSLPFSYAVLLFGER